MLHQVALSTEGDRGLGRARASACAKEGADVVTVYLDQYQDTAETRWPVEEGGRKRLPLAGDVGREEFQRDVILRTLVEFRWLDPRVNNAADFRLGIR